LLNARSAIGLLKNCFREPSDASPAQPCGAPDRRQPANGRVGLAGTAQFWKNPEGFAYSESSTSVDDELLSRLLLRHTEFLGQLFLSLCLFGSSDFGVHIRQKLVTYGEVWFRFDDLLQARLG
jgi:hypothetical protein